MLSYVVKSRSCLRPLANPRNEKGPTLDTFNYLSVMISIILGVGLTQLFAGIGNLLQLRHRVNQYWLHVLWALILIVSHMHLWWSLWAMRESVLWTYPLFLYVLIGPAGLVIAGHIIIPGEFYEEIAQGNFDLKYHYYETSRLFFGIFAGVLVWAMFLEPVLGVRSLFVEFRMFQAFGLAVVSSCAVSKNRILHTIAALVTVVLLAVIVFFVRFRAGAFDFH
jgi:hypothetical protein